MKNDSVHTGGLIHSDVPGRTDKINMNVFKNAYVIPADIVSALGEGNTLAGAKVLEHMLGPVKNQSSFASGGRVPIIAAGGEFVVHPFQVAKIGKGKIKHGHDVLDELVKKIRTKNIKETKKLPPPKKD